jgi:serine/threonine protein kinase
VKTTPIIDDYQCIREIGRGSYGSVYRARDKRTNELRAIKIIDKQNMTHHEK